MNKNKALARISLFLTAIMFISLFSASCTREEEPPKKGMQEIHEDEGLPVTIEIISKKDFKEYLTFYATLSGIKETTKFSNMADKISKINADVGDYVKEGQVLVEFPTDNPTVNFEQAKAAYELSKKNHERMKALYESGDIAKAKLDGAETQFLVDKRNFEAMKQIVMVEAPISGQVVEMKVKEGDDIGMQKPLFTVAQLTTMKAKLWASEQEVAKLKKGMEAVIQNGGIEHKGTIREIAMAMDDFRKAFGVEVHFRNPKKLLKSGVTTEVKIKTYENPDAIAIQKNLLIQQGDDNYVYLVRNGKAVKQQVQTGGMEDINVEITQGLQPGDSLINCCKSLLEEGIKVKVRNKGEK